MTQEPQLGWYVYCFAAGGLAAGDLGPSIDEVHPLERVECDGICALVSQVLLDDFQGSQSSEFLNDINWVGPRATRHAQVVAQVSQCQPVLPVAFGAVFYGKDAVGAIIREHHQEIAQFLESAAGRDEWAVKAYVDETILARYLDEARKQLPSAQAATPGKQYFQQVRAESLKQQELREHCRFLGLQIHDRLRQAADDSHLLRLRQSSVAGRSEAMILNAAMLVARDRLAEFQHIAAQVLDQYRDQGLLLEQVGPWPLYNFCPRLGQPAAEASR